MGRAGGVAEGIDGFVERSLGGSAAVEGAESVDGCDSALDVGLTEPEGEVESVEVVGLGDGVDFGAGSVEGVEEGFVERRKWRRGR